jgi:cysteine desulfurase/selenocysteine lyase
MSFDPQEIKKDFPIFRRQIDGRKLVYLDNAATTQKPRAMIERLSDYYTRHNANIHRGIHTLSEEATAMYESARQKVATFIGAASPREIIFVRNSTEAINLVARAWGEANLKDGDEVILTIAEHHSNIVPWQQLARKVGIRLRYLKVDEEGRLDLNELRATLNAKTKLLAVSHVSNVLGIVNSLEKIVKIAHERGIKVLVDSSQGVPRLPINVSQLGVDFLVFTGHKMCGPTGIGVLWAREELLQKIPPFMGGGDMIKEVTTKGFSVNDLPHKFEAGTPNIAGAIGLGAAVDYLLGLGMDEIAEHEGRLTDYALGRLSEIKGLTIYGPQFGDVDKTGVISFNLNGVHAHDVAQVLDSKGIAIRSGHHCAMPLMQFLGINACARASFYIYNTKDDVDRLIEGIHKVKKVFEV